MKNAVWAPTVVALLFLQSTVGAALSLRVADEAEQLSVPKGAGGWTKVAPGNVKGQTFVVRAAGDLRGVILQVAEIQRAGDLSIALHAAVDGIPVGKPLFEDVGELPDGLRAGDSLKIGFAAPVNLQPGTYALILITKASELTFRLDGRNGYGEGRAVRRNRSTKGDWKMAGSSGSDLAFRLIGEIEAATRPDSGDAAPATLKLARHENPAFVPARLGDLNKRPNIVVCMVDDLGWNQIGVSQSTMGTNPGIYKTPNLARLAAGGLSFTHAYTQPNCAPTRAAMLSGQYPARVHNDVYIVGNLNRHRKPGITREEARFLGPKQTEDVAVEAVTVAEALRRNGYATAHIGKYHVGGHQGGDATLPENAGFDINIGGFGQGHQPVCFARQDSGGGWKFNKLGRGDFDRFGAPYTEAYLKRHGFPLSLLNSPKHVCDALADAMEETLATFAAGGKPFYLQLHPYAVHGPVSARPDLKAAAGGDEFVAFVSSVDLIVGRLLKKIGDPNGDGDESDSLIDNTLILFTSDNGGTHKDNFPLRGKKGMFTEGGVRVPLIAYWPGVIPANTVSDHMVHSVDYYPTYLKLAGEKWTPPVSRHPLDGESFADVLLNPNLERVRKPIFYLFPGYMDVRAQPCVVVIDEIQGLRYKLLYFYEANDWELYNLSDDIAEKTNLIQREPKIAARLSAKIRAWLTQVHSTWKPKFPLIKETGKSAGPPPLL